MLNKIIIAMCVALLSGNAVAQNNDTDVLVGATVGGLIGNSIGDGDGRKIATALGIIIGARMADGERYESRDFVRECRRNVPGRYRGNDGARQAWIRGCVHNLEEIQANLEQEAYKDGLNQ